MTRANDGLGANVAGLSIGAGAAGALLDDEQEVAGLDLLALGEGPLLQEALDARHQIDRVDRLDTPNESSGGRHALEGRGGDRDRGNRRRGGRLVRVLRASATAKRRGENDDRGDNSPAGRPSQHRNSTSEFAESRKAWRRFKRPRSGP